MFQHYDCRNHIRVIQPMGDGSRLYVCGTNAHNPKDLVIYVSTDALEITEWDWRGSGELVREFSEDLLDMHRQQPPAMPAPGNRAEFDRNRFYPRVTFRQFLLQ